MNKVGITTQASTVENGMILTEVGGKTLLEHHLDRLEAAGLPVVVATSTAGSDDRVAEIASGRGLSVHRGSETDVLERFHDTAARFGLDVIVRVIADSPLVDGLLIATAVEEYLAAEDPWLFLSNTQVRSFPRGFDFEVFGIGALAMAHAQAKKAPVRAQVTAYITNPENPWTHPRDVIWPDDRSGYRLVVDTAEDLERISALIEEHAAASLSVGQIVALLDEHADLAGVDRDSASGTEPGAE
jgi:spore coat polysaccharide biosynthesis protein SpsF